MSRKNSSRSFSLVGLAIAIIMWLSPRQPWIIIISLLAIFVIFCREIWNLRILKKSSWRRIIAILFVALCIGRFGYFVYPHENLKPKLDIKIYPEFDPRNQTQLREYSLLIQNLNHESVAIEDFRIEFVFKDIIEQIRPMPLLPSGPVSIAGIKIYAKDDKGKESSYEEKPIESSITKNFSLEIQTAESNNKTVNTNILVFNCSKWPAGASYSADIILNLYPKSEIKTGGPLNQFYTGIYYYYLGGKRMEGTVSGSIPPY